MEVEVLEHEGFAPESIVMIRAGQLRRQAKLNAGVPFQFPSLPLNANPFSVEIFQPLGSKTLNLSPDAHAYKVKFPAASDAQKSTLELLIQEPRWRCAQCGEESRMSKIECYNCGSECPKDAQPTCGYGAQGADAADAIDTSKGCSGCAPPTTSEDLAKKASAAAQARDYLQQHSLVDFVQDMLKTVLKEKPHDPYAFMSSHARGRDVINAEMPHNEAATASKDGAKEPTGGWFLRQISRSAAASHQAILLNGEQCALTILQNDQLGQMTFEVHQPSINDTLCAVRTKEQFDALCREVGGSRSEQINRAIVKIFNEAVAMPVPSVPQPPSQPRREDQPKRPNKAQELPAAASGIVLENKLEADNLRLESENSALHAEIERLKSVVGDDTQESKVASVERESNEPMESQVLAEQLAEANAAIVEMREAHELMARAVKQAELNVELKEKQMHECKKGSGEALEASRRALEAACVSQVEVSQQLFYSQHRLEEVLLQHAAEIRRGRRRRRLPSSDDEDDDGDGHVRIQEAADHTENKIGRKGTGFIHSGELPSSDDEDDDQEAVVDGHVHIQEAEDHTENKIGRKGTGFINSGELPSSDDEDDTDEHEDDFEEDSGSAASYEADFEAFGEVEIADALPPEVIAGGTPPEIIAAGRIQAVWRRYYRPVRHMSCPGIEEAIVEHAVSSPQLLTMNTQESLPEIITAGRFPDAAKRSAFFANSANPGIDEELPIPHAREADMSFALDNVDSLVKIAHEVINDTSLQTCPQSAISMDVPSRAVPDWFEDIPDCDADCDATRSWGNFLEQSVVQVQLSSQHPITPPDYANTNKRPAPNNQFCRELDAQSMVQREIVPLIHQSGHVSGVADCNLAATDDSSSSQDGSLFAPKAPRPPKFAQSGSNFRPGFNVSGSCLPHLPRPRGEHTRLSQKRSKRRVEALLTPLAHFRNDLQSTTCMTPKKHKGKQAAVGAGYPGACDFSGSRGRHGLAAITGVDLPWGRATDLLLNEGYASARGNMETSRRGRKLELAFFTGDLAAAHTGLKQSPADMQWRL